MGAIPRATPTVWVLKYVLRNELGTSVALEMAKPLHGLDDVHKETLQECPHSKYINKIIKDIFF